MPFLNFITKKLDLMKFSRFRIEYDEELSNEQFNKIEEKFDRKAKEIFEKETSDIGFRTLDDVDDMFEEIYGDLALTLSKLKNKYPIQNKKWLDEKLASLNAYLAEEQEVKAKLTEILSDLSVNLTKDNIRLIHLYSNILYGIYESMNFLKNTLFQQKYHRKSHYAKILRVFNALTLLFLRITELDRHWDFLDEDSKKVIENLITWDLDTLSNVTQSLEEFKKDFNLRKKPDKDLLVSIWG